MRQNSINKAETCPEQVTADGNAINPGLSVSNLLSAYMLQTSSKLRGYIVFASSLRTHQASNHKPYHPNVVENGKEEKGLDGYSPNERCAYVFMRKLKQSTNENVH